MAVLTPEIVRELAKVSRAKQGLPATITAADATDRVAQLLLDGTASPGQRKSRAQHAALAHSEVRRAVVEPTG